MVEFAMVILPVLLILVGVIQFGLLFGAEVSLTNAAREGARAGTIFVYDNSSSTTRSTNDLNRCTAAVSAARQAFGLLRDGAPQFTASATCATGQDLNADGLNDRWTNGDATVSYCATGIAANAACPTTGVPATFCTRTDATGCLVRVEIQYHSDIIVPLIGSLLPADAGGRFVHRAVATMVIN